MRTLTTKSLGRVISQIGLTAAIVADTKIAFQGRPLQQVRIQAFYYSLEHNNFMV